MKSTTANMQTPSASQASEYTSVPPANQSLPGTAQPDNKHEALMQNISALRGEFTAFCKDRFDDMFKMASTEKQGNGDHAYWVHIQICDVQGLLDTVERLAKEIGPCPNAHDTEMKSN